jgi:zinc protease
MAPIVAPRHAANDVRIEKGTHFMPDASMKTSESTSVRTLGNGLKVILRESHDAPVASFWVWYRVGARNEIPGLTGLSHWVEHMQFKGTPTLGKGAIFGEISRNGGVNNAMTSSDWTAYYETLPADRIDLAIKIEADRMSNSLFDPAETESERTVILSERQGAENNPGYLLYEEVVGTAFRAHPYRHMVIGEEVDLRSITRDDLYGHYKRAYHPANAFVVAVGDFDADALAKKIDEAFGSIPAGEPLPPVRASEPEQRGERRIVLRRPAPTAYLLEAYRSPEGTHPDMPAIFVADAVLSGGKPMGRGGGGMGRSARLYRALVATGLARSASSNVDFTVDPYVWTINATALPGGDRDKIEEAIDRVIADLAAATVSDEELNRAVKQFSAQFVYAAEGVTNQAMWLGQMEMLGDALRVYRLLDEIKQVTAADVQRVVRQYLTPNRRTVGWLVPDAPGGGQAQAPVNTAAFRLWGADGAPTPIATSRFQRAVLDNGFVVIGQAQPDDRAVSVRIRVEAGSSRDPEESPGLAAFTARMLLRGSKTIGSAAELNERTDNLGATISVDAGRMATELRVRCLREDLLEMLDIAADVLRNPTFPDEEIDKVRQEILTGIAEQESNTGAMSEQGLRELIYPDGHPLRWRVSGTAESVGAITADDMRAFHRLTYGPNLTTVAIVGGFDDLDAVADEIDARFRDWSTVNEPDPIPPVAEPGNEPRRKTAGIPGKSQADVAIGYLSLARSDPDYYALEVANLILGRLGMMGRLGANVRDKQGLAYYVYSVIDAGRKQSLWTSRAGVDPGNIDRAIAGVLDEAKRLRSELVSEQEFADAKSFSTGVLPLALETNDGIAANLLAIEHFDLGLDYLERYPKIINALTREQLLEAAKRHLDPDRFAISVAEPANG